MGHGPGDDLRRQTVEFIRDLADWRLFVTLTFNRDVYPEAAHGAVKEFLRRIARDHERRHVQVALGCGWQTGGRLHYHLLVAPLSGGDFVTDARAIERLWRRGNVEVKAVRDREDASGYIVKHDNWTVAVACDRTRPCRRKHGCRHDEPFPSLGEIMTT